MSLCLFPGDTYKSVMHNHSNKQVSIERMKTQMATMEKDTASKMEEVDTANAEFNVSDTWGWEPPLLLFINSLAPGGFDYSLKLVNFKLISTIDICIFCEIDIRWMPQYLTNH